LSCIRSEHFELCMKGDPFVTLEGNNFRIKVTKIIASLYRKKISSIVNVTKKSMVHVHFIFATLYI
jgi:hypothetical protein